MLITFLNTTTTIVSNTTMSYASLVIILLIPAALWPWRSLLLGVCLALEALDHQLVAVGLGPHGWFRI